MDDLTLGGRPVADLLRTRRHRLVDEVVAEIVRQIPAYADLPPDLLSVDIRAVVRENLEAFEAGLVGRGAAESTLAAVTASAYRRAEEGIPLGLVHQAYLTGAATAWDTVTAGAGPADGATLRRMGRAVLDHLADVLVRVAGAYLEELRMSGEESQSVRTSLLTALLSGTDVPQVAATVGITLPESYVVVALRVEPPGPGDPAGSAAVAARRRLRAVRAALTDDRVNVPLFELDPRGGLLLLPHTPGDDLPPPDIAALVARLSTATAADVWAGRAVRPVAEVPAALDEARDVLDLVVRTARPPGSYAVDDVLLDYQLSRPGPVTALLRERLAPLAERPDLVATLRAHLATGQSRPRTAAAVSVHPNTVDYRLRRIQDLVGLDPSSADDLALLRAGLLQLDA